MQLYAEGSPNIERGVERFPIRLDGAHARIGIPLRSFLYFPPQARATTPLDGERFLEVAYLESTARVLFVDSKSRVLLGSTAVQIKRKYLVSIAACRGRVGKHKLTMAHAPYVARE